MTFFTVIFVTVTWSGCFNLCSSEMSHLSKLPLQVWNQFSSASFKKLAELPQSWQIVGAIHGCNFARLLYMRWWAMMVGPKMRVRDLHVFIFAPIVNLIRFEACQCLAASKSCLIISQTQASGAAFQQPCVSSSFRYQFRKVWERTPREEGRNLLTHLNTCGAESYS